MTILNKLSPIPSPNSKQAHMTALLFSPSLPIRPAAAPESHVRPICRVPQALTHHSHPEDRNLTYTRRAFLHTLAYLPVSLAASAAYSALDFQELHGLDETPDSLPPFRTVDGVRLQEVTLGTGPLVTKGNQVSVKYVLRRSNGYFIDASYGFDRFDTYGFRFGSPSVIDGFNIGVEGMREGGRRRFIVPPDLGYVKGTRKQDPGPIPPEFGPRRALTSHSHEPLVFEVLIVRVKSMPS